LSSKPPRGPDTPDPSETTDGDRTLYPHEVASSAYEKSSLDEPATSLVPFELPTEERYEERGVIAYGGMGVIERLYDRRLGRTVVRKTAHPSPPTLETRLAKEAWVISQLDHPGIIQVLDAGSLRTGGGYYTMPLVHGRSLRDVLAEPLATDERRRLLRQIRDACEAVGYAHQEGFVHRDLKPDNIMVGDFGDTRVMDWGLARPASGAAGDRWREHFPKQQVALTKVGAVLGTPAYMSPEQARGEPLGATADVWSLGAIIYEILSGGPLFPGTDARAVLTGVAQGADRSLERLGDEIPGPLKAILRRSLHQEPGGRFTDAKELSDELTRFLEGRAVESHRYTSAEQIGNLVVRWKIPIIAATASFSIGLVGSGTSARLTDSWSVGLRRWRRARGPKHVPSARRCRACRWPRPGRPPGWRPAGCAGAEDEVAGAVVRPADPLGRGAVGHPLPVAWLFRPLVGDPGWPELRPRRSARGRGGGPRPRGRPHLERRGM
jgi:serine/threonine protein kinase